MLTLHYNANSFTKVTPRTEDRLSSQSQHIACNVCNTVKYAMYSKSCTRQRFTVTDYRALSVKSQQLTTTLLALIDYSRHPHYSSILAWQVSQSLRYHFIRASPYDPIHNTIHTVKVHKPPCNIITDIT